METAKNRTGSKADEDPAASFPELLHFCARAQTLIGELLLLSDRIPSEFLDRRFEPVLFDLEYFDSPSDFESRIEGNADLEALEDHLRESCSAYMQRFFILVNGIVVYHMELLQYLNDLQEGLYVQYTLEGVLESYCGCQLLTESITLFGCLLLLMEHKMGGFLREKLLVAHLRIDHCLNYPMLEKICSLCRAHLPTTGTFSHASSSQLSSDILSVQKTEDLFARFPISKLVVDSIICCLRGNDMYNHIRHYPDPQHRTTALSLQGGCLYVLLFYSPEFLHNGLIMREIIDRFFKDNWVIPIFLHFSVDLFVSWDAYREAKASLYSCLSPTFIRDCCLHHCTKVKHLLSELGSTLSDGDLNKDYVLDNSQHLVSFIRNCNVTLRWLLLHRISYEKKSRDLVTSVSLAQQVDEDSLLQLLLMTSQLEFEVKKIYNELLKSREAIWNKKKLCASECIKNLSHNHFGTWASSCKFKNTSLKDWFEKLSMEVDTLNYTESGSSSRVIYRVISALKDVEQLHQIEESLQIKHGLSNVQKHLHDMIKIINLDTEATSVLSVITDAVYAWGYISRFDELIKKKIRHDSSIVLILHALFLKFHLLLNVPLVRIKQCRSPDLLCISTYYSSKYAAKIFAVLEIIPVILLDIFDDYDLRADVPFHLNRVDKEKFGDFFQLDRQLNLARQTKRLAIVSEGIEIMATNLNCLINLDTRKWLEGNVQKELSRRLESKLESFHLSTHAGCRELEDKLSSLSTFLHAQLQMMESFQDVLHINGIRIWEETLTDVLQRSALKEQTNFTRKKQESTILVAQLNDLSKSQTFFGHLMHQMIRLTDPSRSMFIEPMIGWFDADGHELLGLHFFSVLESCIGQVGLASLDSLLAMLIKENLEHMWKYLNVLLDAKWLEELHKLDKLLGPSTSIPLLGWSSYNHLVKMVNKSWEPLVEYLATVGQLQLVRCLISFKLKSTCKIKAGAVTFAAEGMITSIYSQREKILACIQAKEEDFSLGHFLHELDEQRKLCGLLSPLQTVYISEKTPILLGRFACVFSISQLPRYVFDVHLGTLTSRSKKSIIDFFPMVLGLGTFLRQFHPFCMTQYIQFMGQYTRTAAETAFGAISEPQKGFLDYTSEVLKAAFWTMFFCKYMKVPQDLSESCLPSSLVAILQT
ncbi:uncharacterized protein [Typha angustifolia]|uniref:uncharacterized protein n=1 Tax=Typha angustifolia TaxID=59011 RepID=UPI003C2CCED7